MLKISTILIAIVLSVCANATIESFGPAPICGDWDIDWAFYQFVREYNRSYATQDEYHRRRAIFEVNYDFIHDHQSKLHSYHVGVNNYMDALPEEYHPNHAFQYSHRRPIILTTYEQNTYEQTIHELSAAEIVAATGLPAEVDWRTKGAVTPKESGPMRQLLVIFRQ